MVIAQRSLNDKLRTLRRAEVEPASEIHRRAAVQSPMRDNPAAGPSPVGLDEVLAALDSETDREITRLWLRGMDHAEISVALNLSHAAVRKRWERIKAKLRTRFEAA
jgi:DNA-directed RNA polymerase specialized sigma24 family protein